MADRIQAGIPAPGEADLPITRSYPVSAAFRFYTTDDGGVTKDYLDLTDYTVSAQVRRTPTSPVILELDVEIPAQTGDDLGKVTVSADADATDELTAMPAEWDLRLVDGDGVPRRWLKGSAPISDPVTEEEGS